MTSKNSPANKHAMKDAILDAAIEVFARLGYEGANFREISELCGAKRSLILYHYSNKSELWRCATEAVNERMQKRLRHYWSPHKKEGDKEKLHHLLSGFLRASTDVPEYGRIILREGLSPNPRIEWIASHMTPPEVETSYFEDPDFGAAAFSGLNQHILGGAIMYMGNMGALIEMDPSIKSKRGLNPLSPKNIEETVSYLTEMVAFRASQIKAKRQNKQANRPKAAKA